MHAHTRITAAIGTALLITTAVALPAEAASKAVTDPKNDVQTSTVDMTTYETTQTVAEDPHVDVLKLTAKNAASALVVTIKAADVTRSGADAALILVRTKKTKTAKYTFSINISKPKLSLLITKKSSDFIDSGIHVKIKSGKHGTITVTIDPKWIDNARSVSVSAGLTHVESLSVSTADITGDVGGTSSKSIHWTGFSKF